MGHGSTSNRTEEKEIENQDYLQLAEGGEGRKLQVKLYSIVLYEICTLARIPHTNSSHWKNVTQGNTSYYIFFHFDEKSYDMKWKMSSKINLNIGFVQHNRKHILPCSGVTH